MPTGATGFIAVLIAITLMVTACGDDDATTTAATAPTTTTTLSGPTDEELVEIGTTLMEELWGGESSAGIHLAPWADSGPKHEMVAAFEWFEGVNALLVGGSCAGVSAVEVLCDVAFDDDIKKALGTQGSETLIIQFNEAGEVASWTMASWEDGWEEDPVQVQFDEWMTVNHPDLWATGGCGDGTTWGQCSAFHAEQAAIFVTSG